MADLKGKENDVGCENERVEGDLFYFIPLRAVICRYPTSHIQINEQS